jgi:tRNA-dihydrouridine synthase B
VIGNGGVHSALDVLRMFTETGVDGVMIGKAAIGNPWIFQQAWLLLHGRRFTPPSMPERRAVIAQHLQALIVHKERAGQSRRHPQNSAEVRAVLHFRAHLAGYIRGLKKSAEVRRTLQDMRRAADVMAAVDSLQVGEASICKCCVIDSAEKPRINAT